MKFSHLTDTIILFGDEFDNFQTKLIRVGHNLHLKLCVQVLGCRSKLDKLIFEEITFDRLSAVMAGKIRANLSKQGTPIGPYDIMIAGQAVAHNLILITHNVKEFQRVADLKVEDWIG